MRFTYCPDCGTKLIPRPIGDEGLVPYCDACGKPLFDMFSTCIIVLVVNEFEEAALLKQYGRDSAYRTLVAGYIKPGESAEECTRREVKEELGLDLEELQLVGTEWFSRRDQLMVKFLGRVKKASFTLSEEVEDAVWVKAEDALALTHPGKAISTELVRWYLREKR